MFLAPKQRAGKHYINSSNNGFVLVCNYPNCNQRFKGGHISVFKQIKINLDYHRAKQHNINRIKYEDRKCNKCNDIFNTIARLQAHRQSCTGKKRNYKEGTCRISNCKHTASTNNGLCNKCLHDENVKKTRCFCGGLVAEPYDLGYCSNHVKRLEPKKMEELEICLKTCLSYTKAQIC